MGAEMLAAKFLVPALIGAGTATAISAVSRGGPKVVKPPPVQPPLPVPEVGEKVGEQARRKRSRGFRETFLTGDLVPETGRKKVFG